MRLSALKGKHKMKYDALEIAEVQVAIIATAVVELSELELLFVGGGTGEVVIA